MIHWLQFDDLNPGDEIVVQYLCPAKGYSVSVVGEYRSIRKSNGQYFLHFRRTEGTWALPTSCITAISESVLSSGGPA